MLEIDIVLSCDNRSCTGTHDINIEDVRYGYLERLPEGWTEDETGRFFCPSHSEPEDWEHVCGVVRPGTPPGEGTDHYCRKEKYHEIHISHECHRNCMTWGGSE